MKKPLRVLFVAGLTPVADGSTGGQMAVASAIFESPLRDLVEFVPLSSSMQSMPLPPVHSRAVAAMRRVAKFATVIRTIDVAVIFAADGLSVYEKGLMAGIARAAGCGVVVRISSGFIPQQVASSPVFARTIKLVLRLAHVVCAQGPFWVRYFESFAEAKGKVVLAPNAVALPPKRDRVRSLGSSPQVTFVGAVLRSKGVFELVGAVERLKQRVPNIQLTIAGGGDDLRAVETLVRESNLGSTVTLLGWQTRREVYELLARSDVFVLPSHGEGLPNAVLEAMGAGLPVVCTRVGSLPDIIVDGESGYLVDVGDADGLGSAIERLVMDDDLARAMGERGRETVEATYSVDRVWPRFAEAIALAAERSGRLAPGETLDRARRGVS